MNKLSKAKQDNETSSVCHLVKHSATDPLALFRIVWVYEALDWQNRKLPNSSFPPPKRRQNWQKCCKLPQSALPIYYYPDCLNVDKSLLASFKHWQSKWRGQFVPIVKVVLWWELNSVHQIISLSPMMNRSTGNSWSLLTWAEPEIATKKVKGPVRFILCRKKTSHGPNFWAHTRIHSHGSKRSGKCQEMNFSSYGFYPAHTHPSGKSLNQ